MIKIVKKFFFTLRTEDRQCLNCGQDYCAHDAILSCPRIEEL